MTYTKNLVMLVTLVTLGLFATSASAVTVSINISDGTQPVGSSRLNNANAASRRCGTLTSDRLPIVSSPFG